MVQVVEHPVFRREDFDSARKRAGISAIMLLRNEEAFAQAALDSILPFFDEIVIVYGVGLSLNTTQKGNISSSGLSCRNMLAACFST